MTRPIRVMVVDDSSVARSLLTKILSAEADIEVVATANSAIQAMEKLAANDKPDLDVITLDNNMPEMNGLDALPKIVELVPNTKILMSTLMSKNALNMSMKALEMGAADVFSKPEARGDRNAILTYSEELIHKVRELGKDAHLKKGHVKLDETPEALPEISLKAAPANFTPNILAIGSSTGGPQALTDIFTRMKGNKVDMPIVITQHMPPEFTPLLAEQISSVSGLDAKEGEDGEVLKNGVVYVAPGGLHMTLSEDGDNIKIALTKDAPEHFCRPAVDPMLRSIAAIPTLTPLVVVLTGMGKDGALGAELNANTNGVVMAQDNETSVVWGMPGATARSGCCSFVLPLPEMLDKIIELSAGKIQP